MSTPERRRRHHYVPVHHLERFTATDGVAAGRLWLYQRGTDEPRLVSPRDAAVERYLYAPEQGEYKYDDLVEVFLADHVDGPAAPLMQKLSAGEPLSDEERGRMALYLAVQDVRVPRMRDNVLGFFSDLGETILRMSIERPEYVRGVLLEGGREVSDEDLAKMIEGVRCGHIRVAANKVVWLQTLEVALRVAELVASLRWLVAEARPGFEFVTSDAPVVKVATDSRVPRMLAGGWVSPSAETTFALDPEHVLVVRAEGITDGSRVRARQRWCRDVNSRTIAQADGFVYSRRREGFVTGILDRRGRRR